MRALLSVSDRTGLIDFAKGLAARGFELIATSGTAKAIADAGLKVREVAEFTGAPEMLNGRVKTLHPKVHGALLARPERPDDQADIAKAGLELIDIAAINLYPFKQTISKPHTLAEAIENIDIGGPSMLRSSAKNAQRVLPICDPSDYPRVLEALGTGTGEFSGTFRRALQAKAFQHTAAYDSAIAEYLARKVAEETPTTEMPAVIPLVLERDRPLRYGENPHQKGALYRLPGKAAPSIVDAQVLQGKELSYNNILDSAAAVATLVDVPRNGRPACVVIKHMIPCGVSIGSTPLEAYRKARDADPVSAFGGIVALSHPVDASLAEELSKLFLEVIIAPSYQPDAQELFAKKKNLRLLALPSLAQPEVAEGVGRYELRSIPGGILVQDRDTSLASVKDAKVVSKRAPTAQELEDLALAWAVCKHTRSNAIVFAKDGTAVGVGPGQPNRVDSVRIAATRAGEQAKGAAMASDAFFPFPDSLVVGHECGIRAIVQPGGSVKDAEVIAAADERGMALLFTGERHFRH
jgi:phosphoribosylaminoimidazolecarboxamide formyltransferase/IMP cyclohydrolase